VTEGKGVCTVRHFRRRRGDDGAAAVEFALLFPIFMILALGIINGGLAFSRQINVTQAAREASRYGATLDISTFDGLGNGSHPSGTLLQREDGWLDAVDTATTQSAGNKDNPIGGFNYRCVAIVHMDPTGTAVVSARSKETIGSAAATRASTACTTTSPALIPGATYAQVVLSRNVQFFVLFINPTLHLDAVSTTPYEGSVS
jgi:Flp pilus assembly pilin Flp